jgi:hypothetical protein
MNQQINTFRVFRAGGHFDRLSAINTFPVQRPNIGQKLRYGSPRPNLEPFLEPVPRQNQKRIPREALPCGMEASRSNEDSSIALKRNYVRLCCVIALPRFTIQYQLCIRTVRRMLHKAKDWNLIHAVPKVKLVPEYRRFLTLDQDAEDRLRREGNQLLSDIVVLMRDTGMRNERELYRMRAENIDWNKRMISSPIANLHLAGDRYR